MHDRMNRLLTLATVVAAILCAPTLEAKNCTWNVPPANLNFGTYSVFSTVHLDVTTAFQIQCTPHTNGRITLTRGTNSTSYSPRTARATATDVGNYNLYLDAAGSRIWGDGTTGSTVYEVYNATPQDKVFDDLIFGRVFAGQDLRPGTYTDTITASLSWGSGAPQTRTFTVQFVIRPECTVDSFSMMFGVYNPLGATPLDANSTLRVYCTRGTTGQIAMGNGVNFGGGTRRMRGAVDLMMYNLFRDSGRVTVWNSTNMATATSTSKLTPLGGGFTIFGRIPAGQNVGFGNYTDTVVATVNY